MGSAIKDEACELPLVLVELLTEERARRLKILQAQALEVSQGGWPLDAEGVALVGALVIPKPVFFSVGENDEGGAEVFGEAAGLLLGLVGVKVRPLGFEDAERASTKTKSPQPGMAVPHEERSHVIGTAATNDEERRAQRCCAPTREQERRGGLNKAKGAQPHSASLGRAGMAVPQRTSRMGGKAKRDSSTVQADAFARANAEEKVGLLRSE